MYPPTKFPSAVSAFDLGVSDGMAQPFDLTMGMTWENDELNEQYDRGVNFGQNITRLLMGGI